MVRRVGFGNSRKAAPRRTTLPENRQTAGAKRMSGAPRMVALVFLPIWLIGWTAGIAGAAFFAINGEVLAVRAFLVFWVVAASIGWIFAVRAWLKLLQG